MFHVFAYLDAGTGSMFVQAVIGVVLAGTVVFRTYIQKILSKVKINSRKKITSEES